MSFWSDLRYATRSLARSPALTAALLVTVAIGIGTYATIAGLIDGLLESTMTIPGAQGLVAVYARDSDGRYRPLSLEEHGAIRSTTTAFEAVAGFGESRARVTVGERSAWMPVATATPDIWALIGVRPALGRTVAEGEPMPVVISDRLWRDVFDSKAAAIGSELAIGGGAYRVAAVLPDWFQGVYLGRPIDVWMPAPASGDARPVERLWTLARLRPGIRIGGAEVTLPPAPEGAALVILPFTGIEPEIQVKFTRVRRLLDWAAALVFLTAAANVAGFLLSRAARRAPETAARIALGATRAHLTLQIVADSVVVSVAGAVLGGLVAYWTGTAAPALFYAEDAARLHAATGAWHGAYGASIYTAIMLLCGLAPLAGIRRHGTLAVLRQSENAGATRIGLLRTVLVVTQMAICVVLVIGTALLFAAFHDALRTARAENLGEPLVATLEAEAGYGDEAKGEDYFRRVEAAVSGAPGVTGVAWASTLPGGRASETAVRLEAAPARHQTIALHASVPRGRSLLAFEVRQGRPFGGVDGPFSCQAGLVNEAALEESFGGRAVGRAIEDASGRRIDIVGVVRPTLPDDRDLLPGILFFERQMPASYEEGVRRFQLPILPEAPPPAEIEIETLVVSSSYFDATGATVVAGAGFESDTSGCGIAVVNREAASAYFAGDAVGGAVLDAEGRRARVVGVVDDGALRVMQRRRAATVYFPMRQWYAPRATLIAGASTATPEMIAGVTRRVNAVSGGARRVAVMALDDYLARTSLGPERMGATLVGAAAAVALALALLGAYGVMADAVRQRKREIALRLALGAQSWKIAAAVLQDGARLAVLGAAAGLVVSWIVVRVVVHANPAFGVPALWMWLVSPAALLAIVALAAILPARWALAVDPLTITREN
jgi:putative ABC transport system permease protein